MRFGGSPPSDAAIASCGYRLPMGKPDASVTDYDRLGWGYANQRRPDSRIAAQIAVAVGSVGPVVNVGAGSGSYEPAHLPAVAVEPSNVMLRQRRPGSAVAVRAVAEQLPFRGGTFGAGMAILTVHHWRDCERGLSELRRVVRGRIAVLTWDQSVFESFWMIAEYIPASRRLDRDLLKPQQIAECLGGGTIEVVPVPHDCTDGFYAAYWRRPDAYLDPSVRCAISGLARLDDDEVQPGLKRLEDDLASGAWHSAHADLLGSSTYDAGYRLITSPGM